MAQESINDLLATVAKALNIEKLELDANNTCLIVLPSKLQVNIEKDKTETALVIGTIIAEMPSSRYRENVFRNALISNQLHFPQDGSFAYSPKKSALILMEMIPLEGITGEKVLAVFNPFIEKAQRWSDAITRGELPAPEAAVAGGAGGVFGLRT